MRRWSWILVWTAFGCPGDDGGAGATIGRALLDAELARRWAPIHHQGVDGDGDGSLGGKSDYLAALDFDGDWNMRNNWENAADDDLPLEGTAYYSVVETTTHWYIVYGFFHPRDWCDWPLCETFGDKHENDFEGLLTIVERPSSDSDDVLGELIGMVTVWHYDFQSFVPDGSPLGDGEEDVDGEVHLFDFEGALHPRTMAEMSGHAISASPCFELFGTTFCGHSPGVTYVPTGIADDPESNTDSSVGYELVPIFEAGGLWTRRCDYATFDHDGAFAGDDEGLAMAPWGWDDHDDGPDLTGGELAVDPAHLSAIYFDGFGSFSSTYTYNPYENELDCPDPPDPAPNCGQRYCNIDQHCCEFRFCQPDSMTCP